MGEHICVKHQGYLIRRDYADEKHWWIEKDQRFIDWCLGIEDGRERINCFIEGREPEPLVYEPVSRVLVPLSVSRRRLQSVSTSKSTDRTRDAPY